MNKISLHDSAYQNGFLFFWPHDDYTCTYHKVTSQQALLRRCEALCCPGRRDRAARSGAWHGGGAGEILGIDIDWSGNMNRDGDLYWTEKEESED